MLLIHGGGWNALTKESLEPIARLAVSESRAVFSINYRLLDHAPWPACGSNCASAARFVLAGSLAPHDLPRAHLRKLLVVGASAGGHLAMMTGLALGARASPASCRWLAPREWTRAGTAPNPRYVGPDLGKISSVTPLHPPRPSF